MTDNTRSEQQYSSLEAVPTDEEPKYLDPNHPPQIAPAKPYGYIHPNPQPQPQPPPSPKPRPWRHRPTILLFSIPIVIILGLVGGLIGMAISHRNSNHSPHASPLPSTATPSCTPQPPPDNPSNSTTPDTRKTFIAEPDLDCGPDSTSVPTLRSDFTNVVYKKICGVDWVSHDIVTFLAPTMSDCIEACAAYNRNIDGRGMVDGDGKPKQCLGASFIRQWTTNCTAAVSKLKTVGNCFLKNEFQSEGGNVVDPEGLEVAGLCLEGSCPSQ